MMGMRWRGVKLGGAVGSGGKCGSNESSNL